MFRILRNSFYDLLCLVGLSSKPRIHLHSSPRTLTASDPTTGKDVSTGLETIVQRCRSLNDYFTPTFWLASGHFSTIYCTLADFSYDTCLYSRRLIQVPDGGSLALDFTPPITPQDPIDSRPILVVLHGLTGGSHESYVVDVLSKITKTPVSTDPESLALGWRGCVVNFRGCAGTPVTSNQLYHGGYTDDLRCALAFISHLAPKAPLYGIGFSLGANVLAKYIGEEGDATPLKAALILGAPWDFYEGHVYLSSSWMKLVYSRAMAANLRRVMTRNRAAFDDDSRIDFKALYGNPNQTLYEFDSLVTRVVGGFPSTEAYYRYASANQYAHNVAIPLLSLSSIDDPIIPATSIPVGLAGSNPNLIFATTKHGGHLGWFSGFFRPRRWISKPVIEFLREVHRADPVPRKHAETLPPQKEGKVPEMGDDMVVDAVKAHVGFKEVAEGLIDASGDDEDDGLIKGL